MHIVAHQKRDSQLQPPVKDLMWFFPTKGAEDEDAIDVSSFPLPTKGEAARHSLAINSQSPGG